MMFDPLLDLFRGKAVTTPPMDGALSPNTDLDDADVVMRISRPDNLGERGNILLYSSGKELRDFSSNRPVVTYKDEITALATNDSGLLAVAFASGKIEVDGKVISGFNCPTAMCFDGGDLFVCNGSTEYASQDWMRDLMQKGSTGSVWRINVASGERVCIAKGLGFANGVVVDLAKSRIVISESWKHRLLHVPLKGGNLATVLPRLPGYPSRISKMPRGYLLCIFAPLNRLVEFVLQEDAYRLDMVTEVDPAFWIAPTLSAPKSFLEPLQNGGVKSMGVHKPWSPSRSCGLVVELDKDFRPIASHHSRANGNMHGVTSAIWREGSIIVASRGGDAILKLAPFMESR
jgi:Strictosidine synthase